MRHVKRSIQQLRVNTINGYPFPSELGMGNIYHACLSYYAGPYAMLKLRFGGQHYEDGSKMLYTDINDAIDACVSGRNDYIIVYPGPWGVDELIDMSAKTDIHMIGAGGLTQDIGSSGPAYIVQTGNFHTIELGSWCEVAGLQIWNKSGYTAIHSNLKQGINVHNNFIRMSASAGICSGINIEGAYGNNYNRVEANKLHHYAGTAGGSCITTGNGTGIDTCRNEVVVFGGVTYDYGIFNNSPGGQANDNLITECGGTAGGGTITVGLQIRTDNGNSAMGNRIGVATGRGLAGGTANRSFVQNFDAHAGGAVAIES